MRLLAIVAWYFVLSYNGIMQIGPFATQAGCESYRAQTVVSLSIPGEDAYTVPCFSTKQ